MAAHFPHPSDMLAFLDQGNIGNAVIAGISHNLNLAGDRYD